MIYRSMFMRGYKKGRRVALQIFDSSVSRLDLADQASQILHEWCEAQQDVILAETRKMREEDRDYSLRLLTSVLMVGGAAGVADELDDRFARA